MAKRTLYMTLLGLGVTASIAVGQTAPTTPPAPEPHPTVNQRLENQKDRIQAGVKDDQLTKAEATKLKADHNAIHAKERADRKANDGHLTSAERRQLNRQLNKNSRDIARARHNNRKPKA